MLQAAVLTTIIAAGSFAFVTSAHGVRVSQRSGTRIIDFVADGTFAALPERVLAVMLDYEYSTEWQKNLAESRVLERGEHTLDVYQRLDLPLVADRDYTLHVTWAEDQHGISIRFSLANDHGPAAKKGVVRVALNEGAWRLERSTDGRSTSAHYEVRMALGGSLPQCMARHRAAMNVPDFFEGLRHRL